MDTIWELGKVIGTFALFILVWSCFLWFIGYQIACGAIAAWKDKTRD